MPFQKNSLREYLAYHHISKEIGDIDPAHAMLRYICDRYELNIEQRYWLAYVYALTYCGPSTFFVYNEFPDFETLNRGRMDRWWESYGREQIICQTDRRWCRSLNQFVDAIENYQHWVGKRTQQERFHAIATGATSERRYDQVYREAATLYTFGQFTLFLYLEALDTITDLQLAPTDLDLNKAWSCRYGLYYAYGYREAVTDSETPIPPELRAMTAATWQDLRQRVNDGSNVWNLETTLCAYRKYHRGKRYLGSYLDRQASEIAKLQTRVKHGVDWDVLWQFRDENVPREYRVELLTTPAKLAKGFPANWVYSRERYTDWELSRRAPNISLDPVFNFE